MLYTMRYEGFLLETPMVNPEYMCIHSKYFSPDIHELYSIDALIADYGYI